MVLDRQISRARRPPPRLGERANVDRSNAILGRLPAQTWASALPFPYGRWGFRMILITVAAIKLGLEATRLHDDGIAGQGDESAFFTLV